MSEDGGVNIRFQGKISAFIGKDRGKQQEKNQVGLVVMKSSFF
jgi:hypothetical protein